MRFISYETVAQRFEGKTVAIVGSAPGVMDNQPGFIDSHDIVVRVNNYKLDPYKKITGGRTDVYYSFYGNSIRKSASELKSDGVKLCMCKCPDSRFTESPWHIQHRKEMGIDFHWIYEKRKDWWFCDTYIPTTEHFVKNFKLLDNHVPSTGFSAILDIDGFDTKSVYLTGFDFFISRMHNVDEAWHNKAGDGDPIGHEPRKELGWLRENAERFQVDDVLSMLL
jgi:hypothetical protein